MPKVAGWAGDRQFDIGRRPQTSRGLDEDATGADVAYVAGRFVNLVIASSQRITAAEAN